MKASTKKDLKIPLHIRAGKGRMTGRMGNANRIEMKKKKGIHRQKDFQHASSVEAQTRRFRRAKETGWKMRWIGVRLIRGVIRG